MCFLIKMLIFFFTFTFFCLHTSNSLLFYEGSENSCVLSSTIIQFLKNSVECVEILSEPYSSEITCIVNKIIKFNKTLVFWSVKPTRSICNDHLFFLNNESNFMDYSFYGSKFTERYQNILIISKEFHFIPDSLNYNDIFGFATVVIISNSSNYILDSPLSSVRRFHKVPPDGAETVWSGLETKDYFKNGTVRAATFNCSLVSMLNNQSGEITGIEGEIVKEIANQLKLKIQLVELKKGNTSNFGYKLGNGTWSGGVMGALYDNEADIAFCTLWMSIDRDEDVEQTTPWGKVDLTFLVPRPHVKHDYWLTIFRPFRYLTWAAIFFMLILASSAHWLLSKISATYGIDYENPPSFLSVVVGMFGALTQCSSVISSSHRHSWIVTSWFVTCIVLSSSYSSNIVARLTLPLFTPRTDSIQQLVEQGFAWGRAVPSNTSMILNMQDPWQRRFMDHFRLFKYEDIHSLISSGKFALQAQALGKYYVYNNDFYQLNDSELVGLRRMKAVTNDFHVSIAVRRGSPLYPAWNLQTQRLLGAGIVDHWQRDITTKHGNIFIQELFVEKDQPTLSQPKRLNFEGFSGAFTLLIVGQFIASVVFLCELRSSYAKPKTVSFTFVN